MYNLDDIIKIYFRYTSAKAVLEGTVPYDAYPQMEFQKKARIHMMQYSDTEDISLYEYAKESIRIEENGAEDGVNVFAALAVLSRELLTMQDNRVVCAYSGFVRWRNVTKLLGETSLVCAYLAWRDVRAGRERKNFCWENVLGHNNTELNRLMERGISENHFHLFGSAPVFELIWLNLMNNVGNSDFSQELGRIDENRRSAGSYDNSADGQTPLRLQHLQAALIRLDLTAWLLNEKEFCHRYRSVHKRIDAILSDSELILEERQTLQYMIEDLKGLVDSGINAELFDYALCRVGEKREDANAAGTVFAGEHWFVYQMLLRIYRGKASGQACRLFYAYLLIKVDIQSELLQVNDTVGFENFSIYSHRKREFLNGYINNKHMMRNAVYGSIQTGNLRSLEARIAPQKTAYENAEMLLEYDAILSEDQPGTHRRELDWFYYVFHFIKGADELPKSAEDYCLTCRHERKRRELQEQASAIIELREGYPEIAARVRGIDACAQEIGCRPEVFASVFRRLGEHVCGEYAGEQVAQLRKTYHVGEDFLDAVDGLRAVEEAVRFLDFKCGDRIGHGTVLGIDLRKWYRFKNNTILISKQDYLDNIVWMYHKLREFEIDDCTVLKSYLEKEFEACFTEIYETHIDRRELKRLLKSTQKGKAFANRIYQFNIFNYYDAWKLRGDEPELYRNGYFHQEDLLTDSASEENYYRNGANIRQNIESTLLYYLYHYCWGIRAAGQKPVEIFVPPYYVEGAIKIQKAMQRYIGNRGIGIETNPTSNLLISTIADYDEHPILNFYNKELAENGEERRDCPQLWVSVNTDDKGIFHTSLENEYAYLACSLEKVRNKDGNYKYNRQMIYDWLDHIRIMGNDQSFGR